MAALRHEVLDVVISCANWAEERATVSSFTNDVEGVSPLPDRRRGKADR
jgi:hypothetical protein